MLTATEQGLYASECPREGIDTATTPGIVVIQTLYSSCTNEQQKKGQSWSMLFWPNPDTRAYMVERNRTTSTRPKSDGAHETTSFNKA